MKHLALIIASLLTFSACGKGAQLKAVKPARASVESTLTTTSSGTVEAEQQAVLGFTAAGRVARIAVSTGDAVKRGQVLAELESADLKSILENSASELKRAEELFRSGLIAKAAFDDARKNYEVARVNLDRSRIVAPFGGLVTEVNLELGELSQSATATAAAKAPIRIIDTQPRIIRGEIDEMDMAKVKVGVPARIRILAVGPKPFPAKVTRVVPYVSTTKEQDRTSQIELKLDSPDTLVPVGASAEVEIIIDRKDDALALPARAVLGVGQQRYVFRLDGGKMAKVEVKTGVGNYERMEVLSGVSPDDVILLPGENIDMKDGMKVSAEVQPWP